MGMPRESVAPPISLAMVLHVRVPKGFKGLGLRVWGLGFRDGLGFLRFFGFRVLRVFRV